MNKAKVNKLSIYLIREGYEDEAAILRDNPDRKWITVNGIGTFYYEKSVSSQPGWIKGFFGSSVQTSDIFGSVAKGLLLTKVEVAKDKSRTFAIAFGFGWTLLDQNAIEERFGLKVVLNTVNPKSVRRVDKKHLTATPKDTYEQLSRASEIADFGIDIEQDLVMAITGASRDEKFGMTLAGKDALSVSVTVDYLGLKDFLKLCFEKYEAKDYQSGDFAWIDQIEEVKDPAITGKLETELIARLKNGQLENIWMSVPEIVDWAGIDGFKYRQSKKWAAEPDIELTAFLASLSATEKQSLSIDALRNKYIFCYGATTQDVINEWRAYNCLYCEVIDSNSGNTYLLNNGKWYEVEKSFATRVNSLFTTIRDLPAGIALPDCTQKDEGKYNLGVADNGQFICLDKKPIAHGGGHSSVEFCDLFSKDKQLIHVKKYASSSVLSHLFAQGVVSGELFASDAEFRAKLNEKLGGPFKLADTAARPEVKEYTVIYAVISSKDEPLEIPFFSKVSLKNAKRRLEGFGFNVRLCKIKAERSKPEPESQKAEVGGEKSEKTDEPAMVG